MSKGTSVRLAKRALRKGGHCLFGVFTTALFGAAIISAQAQESGQSEPRVLRDCADCPKMVVIPAGSFEMGDTAGNGKREERPVHTVTFSEPFAIGRYEVTFSEWDACVKDGGCDHRPDDQDWGRDNRPVINLSWHDAQAYVKWLSAKTGEVYRLPTEAEWEYAARAGSEAEYSWGNEIGEGRANCSGCGSQWDDEQTAPIGSFDPNSFGLYDVHGNISEWVEDCWHGSYEEAPADGMAWTQGCSEYQRIVRGGYWGNIPLLAQSSHRKWLPRLNRYTMVGFRVARSMDWPAQ